MNAVSFCKIARGNRRHFGCGRDTGGRPVRSSEEVPVMGMEQRGRHVRFQNNLQPKGMIDYYETKSKPITNLFAWLLAYPRNE